MGSIRLSDIDRQNIEIMKDRLPELKNDSAVLKYCLHVMANVHRSVDTKLKIVGD